MAERDDSREPSSALASLLELEANIAHRLTRARAASEDAVLDAKRAVESARGESGHELAEAVAALRDRLESTHRRELAAIDARAHAQASRFDSVDDDAIETLADSLIDYLLALTSTGTPAR